MRVQDAMRQVSAASRAFEGRWTYPSLRTADPDLHELFMGQRRDWEAALVTGDADEIDVQTGGLVRGYEAIAKRMEDIEPCAWQMGQCPNTGLKVAIGTQIAAADYLAPDVVWVSPDEVAMLIASQREVLKIKQLFPGATVEEIAQRQDA